jgi:hypothetical protein
MRQPPGRNDRKIFRNTSHISEALGWIINYYDDIQRVLTFKDGMVGGYCAYIGLDLDTRVAVVVLANKFNWDEKVGMNLLLRISSACADGGSNWKPSDIPRRLTPP